MRRYLLYSVITAFLFTNLVYAQKADFSIAGGNDISFWTENFDENMDVWEIQTTNEEYTWQYRTDLEGNKSFTVIDPNDKASLFISGISAYRHGKQLETLISPAIDIPVNANLTFYLNYSLNFFPTMNIKLKVSEDKGETWIEKWDAQNNSVGERPASWRLIRINMEEFANKEVLLAWEYSANPVSTYDSAGDVVLDEIQILTPGSVDQITILAGDSVKFFNKSEGTDLHYSWDFPGGYPSSSTEENPTVYYYKSGTYNVSLTASNNQSSDAKEISEMVVVNNEKPIALIRTPSMFTSKKSNYYFVPKREDLLFYDESLNYPSEWLWEFTGAEVKSDRDIQNPTVSYNQTGHYKAALFVENEAGIDMDEVNIEAGTSSFVWNMQPGDSPLFSFKMDDNQYFPGNNTKIDAYAEYFDKPAVPALLDSIEIRFAGYSIPEDDIITRISTIRVRVYKAENGQPSGKELAWGIYDVLDIEADRGTPSPIYFGNDFPILIDFPFFVVVENIPMENTPGLNLTMGMASWRDYGNTAYLRKKGDEKFISADSYFGADKHTSLNITPRLNYIILSPEITELESDYTAKKEKLSIYATHSWDASSNKDWCSIINISNGYLEFQLSENNSLEEREATITISNKYREKRVTISQAGKTSSITNMKELSNFYINGNGDIEYKTADKIISMTLYNLSGQILYKTSDSTIEANTLTKGVYILVVETDKDKISGKIIK